MGKIRIGLAVFCVLLCAAATMQATIVGTVQAVVHDPQHLPMRGASVTLKAQDSDWMQTQESKDDGAFEFTAVPVGDYTVTVTLKGFQGAEQQVVVRSDTSPVLHFELGIAGVNETAVVVAGEPVVTSTDSVTTTTLISRADVQSTPGADRTDSMAIITDYVPGAYMVHDMLHVRGGHQFSWLIDGVPVPNTNIATNVGPEIDPKDLDYVEVQRGSYDAAYGDRTYGVFNAVPRTGFERQKECETVVSFGTYYQTNDQINCGGHTQKFAYYGSVNGNRTGLGLETPVAPIIHDAANGYGGFGSLIYNLDSSNQLRFIVSARDDFFQIPNAGGIETQPLPYSPEVVVITPADPGTFFQDDTQREADRYLNFSWVHTFTHNGLLTLSPFYHLNASNYDSSPLDLPNAITAHRSSTYAGGQATVSATVARNTLEGGFYGFWQHDNQLFGVLFNDGSNVPIESQQIVTGNLEAVWVGDKFEVTPWLTLDGGVRQSHFSSSTVDESPTDPRAGVALRVPRLNWILRGFYGDYYQSPPLVTISGPLLGIVNTPTDEVNPQQFIPLRGERDEENQFGLTIPYKGWVLDVDRFHTLSHNFLDHGNVNYDFDGSLVATNIYLPLTTQEAVIRGLEVTIKSPQLWHRGQLHVAYSNQSALFSGFITGGLNNFLYQPGWAPLDHDQKDTLNVGFDVKLPWQSSFAGNVYYGSGFSNGASANFPGLVPAPPEYLSGHAALDLSVSKSFGERFSAAIHALNIFNSHLLIDDSLTFGGFHYDDPREVYGEVRYHFHY